MPMTRARSGRAFDSGSQFSDDDEEMMVTRRPAATEQQANTPTSAWSALTVLALLVGLAWASSTWSPVNFVLKALDLGKPVVEDKQLNGDVSWATTLGSFSWIFAGISYGVLCCLFMWTFTYFDSHSPGHLPTSPLRLPQRASPHVSLPPIRWHLPYVMGPVNGLLVSVVYALLHTWS